MSLGRVLICGGRGLVGLALGRRLKAEGYEVVFLSRENGFYEGFRCYEWNPKQQKLDLAALEGCQVIINLAGANVGEKRWNEAYKKEILESRTLSTRLLYQTLKKQPGQVHTFINASAVGYYGSDTGNQTVTESSPQGSDFLARVVGSWEREAAPVLSLGIRLVILRIGIVLSAKGGAYISIRKPVSMGVGAELGRGLQWFPWIHNDDLCNIFLFAVQQKSIEGIYNAVAPICITNRMFTRLVAEQLKKPFFMPAVPAFVLKLMLGEFAESVLGGQYVSADKLLKAGYKFKYEQAVHAVGALEKTSLV
ncbi:MAG: TIGR01777 family protein [Cytophagales bacterium]|nr:MAG: TIGR01777 family protein [Cytophagales bacterium]TAF60394.1 MAG: TIGR01777 family protein [Cytophagales bacterium]